MEQPGGVLCREARGDGFAPASWRCLAGKQGSRPGPLRTFHVERSADGSALLGDAGADGSRGSGLPMNEFDVPALYIRLLPTGRRGETSGSRS